MIVPSIPFALSLSHFMILGALLFAISIVGIFLIAKT